MADKNRTSQLSIIKDLLNNSYNFSFEQAVYILKNSYKHCDITFESAGRNYLCGSEVSKIKQIGDKVIISSDRMSLTSLNSPMPDTLIDVIKVFEWKKEKSLPDFMSIFSNRLSQISYKVSSRRCPCLQGKMQAKDSTIGCCINALNGDIPLNVVNYAYLMWMRPHSALGLRLLLKSYFNCEVNIEQFHGKFCPISSPTKLGIENNTLGSSAVIGKSFFDYSANIKIIFSDLSQSAFLELQNGTENRKKAEYLIRKYIGHATEFEIKLLPNDKIPTHLNRKNLLGNSSWLIS